MTSFSLKATAVAAMVAVVAVLAATATAGSSYIPTPASPGFLLSPIFLWVAANAIVAWLFVSSSRRRGREADADAGAPSPAAHDGEVAPGAMDAPSSEHEAAFSDAPAAVSKRLQAREARAARRSDRPRVRRKPAPEAGQDAAEARDERRRVQAQEETAPAALSAVVDEDEDEDEEEDVSMDALWASIVQRRAARPAVVEKSESWGNEELPRLQRVAETAAARRQAVRKSASAVARAAKAAAAAAASGQTGWRTRDVLVSISPDELLRRAESFIRRQRLQRQESEQRQQLLLLLQQRRVHGGPAAPLIRAGGV